MEIILSNIKDVKEMRFNVPTLSGIFLIVGKNGVGKTTLLTSIDRIRNSHAFAYGFSVSKYDNTIDQFTNTKITYAGNESTVVYTRRERRWVPTPRSQSEKVFNEFEFKHIIFIKANSDRITPTGDEIKKGNTIQANSYLKDALNEIFETNKFDSLRLLRNGRGKGKIPAQFYVIKNKNEHFSEKRFSSGEIATIRLIESVMDAREKTLILLDETEMALHPRVQSNLYDFLLQLADQKDITILMSTHSSTLIHKTRPDKIFLIDKNSNGSSVVLNPCCPANAIGHVDDISNAGYDYLYFVEDDKAKLILESMIEHYKLITKKLFKYRVIPVGGFNETANFTIRTINAKLSRSKVFCFLDTDAFSINSESKKLEELMSKDNNKHYIRDLTITPELWLIGLLEGNNKKINDFLINTFNYDVQDLFKDMEYLRKTEEFEKLDERKNERSLAKKKYEIFIKRVEVRCNKSIDVVEEKLINFCVENDFNNKVCEIIGPTVNSKR